MTSQSKYAASLAALERDLKRTAAQRVADLLDNEASKLEANDGQDVEELCLNLHARKTEDDDAVLYTFPDGSAIEVVDESWVITGRSPDEIHETARSLFGR